MHTHKPFNEAKYIKVSDRKKEENKRNKKTQRIVSTVAVVLTVALMLAAGVTMVFASSNAYVLKVDGVAVATMVSRSEAQAALDQSLQNAAADLVAADGSSYALSYTNEVEIEEISAVNALYSSVTDAAVQLQDSLHVVAQCVAVYVDEVPVLLVGSSADAIEAVTLAKNHYGVLNEDGVSRVYTTEQVSIGTEYADLDDILSVEEAVNMLLYGQADGVSVADAEPLITINVERETSKETALPYDTVRVDNSELMRGEESLVSEGVDGIQEVTYRSTEVNGVVTAYEEVGSIVLVEAVDEVVEVGTKLVISSRGENGDGEFGWPLASGTGTVTSRFGWRSRGWHSGIDVADAYDSAIYATADGTVSYVGYMSGYGNLIMIDHGNGVETRYAHCNEMLVSEGDEVLRGDGIATIGMTGTTTGPHVHFEIRVDGTAVDPLPYLEE